LVTVLVFDIWVDIPRSAFSLNGYSQCRLLPVTLRRWQSGINTSMYKKGRYFSTLYFIQHHHGLRFIALAFLISFLC
jgi:hypothetical protein